MKRSYDEDIAERVGLVGAVLYEYIRYWCAKNEKKGINEHDGSYWTFLSVDGFHEQFPYLSLWQIRSALDKLVEENLIRSGSFNKRSFDRTKWFTICGTPQIEVVNTTNRVDVDHKPFVADHKPFVADHKPIPNKEHNIRIQNSKENIQKKNSRFIKPTVDEVRDYCLERFNEVDPQAFVDYYESKGWFVGKNKMVDWKAAVRTWERKQKPRAIESGNPFDKLLEEELRKSQ